MRNFEEHKDNCVLMRLIYSTFTTALVLLVFHSIAGNTPPIDTLHTSIDSTGIRPDDPVLQALDKAVYGSLFESAVLETDTQKLNVFGFPKDSIPKHEAAYYQAILDSLNMRTPFNLVYNDRVHAFIELYALKRREQTSRMLGLKAYYFPLFEAILDQYEMPLEIKYLAVVESALNPKARSRAGAVGLWQFMYATGKMHDLHQNSYVDERMDPIKSTHAACQYLSHLYGIYGKWDLALAAYNCGPGNVNRAMRRSGSREGNYWDLYPYLPRETRGYVPAFIAVNYIMSNPSAHNLYPITPEASYFEVDTVVVKQPVQLEKVAEALDLSLTYLTYINPSYKTTTIPAYSNKTSFLVLPTSVIGKYVTNEEQVYVSSQPEKESEGKKLTAKFEEDRVIYRVRSGDYLGKIAASHHVSVSNIRRWNGLRSNNIRVGQKLVLYPSGKYAKAAPVKKATGPEKVQGGVTYYTIQRGDTLWDIAKAKGLSVDELKQLNHSVNYRDLKPGTKIIVKKASS